MSPLFFPTVASAHHKYQLVHLNAGHEVEKMSVDELQAYSRETWCALEPEEYYFARQAFRGGMTNIMKYIHRGSSHYVDIQSSYPSCQMQKENLYPVGAPTIEIHNAEFYPCGFCYSDMTKCTHTVEKRISNRLEYKYNKLKVIRVDNIPDLHAYCLAFHGIIQLDMTPPSDLYHPLVTYFCPKRKKVIGDCLPMLGCSIPSNILHRASELGYKVTRIHRADRYVMKESVWRNGLLSDMYLAKIKYSGEIPVKEHERMKKTFMDTIGLDLGDMTQFSDNPVLKQVAKLWLNCGWGKQGESLDHEQTVLFKRNETDGNDFYKGLLLNKTLPSKIEPLGTNLRISYKENREQKRPSLHKTYIPAAIFVTAYGRLALHNELVRIDPPGTLAENLRALMCDTDSIVYACGDHDKSYHTITGDCIGDWEVEKPEREGKGLKSFFAIAPKSYCIEVNQGSPIIHLKGACLSYSHANMITPSIMESLVLAKHPDENERPKFVALPQRQMDYRMGKGNEAIGFRYYQKVVQFQPRDVKGEFSWIDYRVYPNGYSKHLMPK